MSVERPKILDRFVLANCSNTVNTENGSLVHAIPFFGDLRPEAKKLSKKLL